MYGKRKKRVVFMSLLMAMTMTVTGCGASRQGGSGNQQGGSGNIKKVQAADLTKDVKARKVFQKTADEAFIHSQLQLAVELFQSSVQDKDSKDKNLLISPLSIQLALAMTANGADGETKKEMEQLLGKGLTIQELNEYLHTYVSGLPSDEKYKLKIANSIWFRDEEERLTVEKDFLQTNADYYSAQIYRSAFDNKTLKDINNWVNANTDGMIKEMLDKIEEDTIMYLINALTFDAEWDQTYKKNDIYDGTFTNINGEKRSVEMMNSSESRYLDDGKATGFIKNYKQGKYSFAALLPKKDTDINDYITSLTAKGLQETIGSAKNESVEVSLPKFSYEYELTMNDLLSQLGMPTAFDSAAADFTKLGHSSRGNIYIGKVLHKTFIQVDELGTKAGAATVVEMKDEAAPMQRLEVRLDRPFVYMILNNETNLPLFIGTVMDIEK